MEKSLLLRPPIEEQDVPDELFDIIHALVFQRKDYIILKKNMETIKTNKPMKLILPFPHFLRILGNTSNIFVKETALQESQTEQENIIQANTEITSDNNRDTNDCQ